jgi:hypothetical protein
VAREIEHYNLDAILAVGFRVRSHRGTQFRKWAQRAFAEYLVKGFTMDDERLKNPPGQGHTDYFDELLERIRDIRASASGASTRRCSTSTRPASTTTPTSELSQRFFADRAEQDALGGARPDRRRDDPRARRRGPSPSWACRRRGRAASSARKTSTIAKNYLTERARP